MVGEDLRLADGGDRDSRRPLVDLQPRDPRALVRLHVGAQGEPAFAGVLCHGSEVAVEHVPVDEQDRREQIVRDQRPGPRSRVGVRCRHATSWGWAVPECGHDQS